jgi:hypothetical protein
MPRRADHAGHQPRAVPASNAATRAQPVWLTPTNAATLRRSCAHAFKLVAGAPAHDLLEASAASAGEVLPQRVPVVGSDRAGAEFAHEVVGLAPAQGISGVARSTA